MKKTDLLSALGKIDKEYLNRALERAESAKGFSDDEDITEVGIMDSKNYIRKKLELIVAVAASVVLCVGTLLFVIIRNNSLKYNEKYNSNSQSANQTTITTTKDLVDSFMTNIEPYVSGDKLYFGVCTVNYVNPDTDYLLEAVVYDADNLGEPIEELSKSCLKVDIASGVETDVLIDLDYDDCPENLLIKCTFSIYRTGNRNNKPTNVWQFSLKHNKSKIVDSQAKKS